MSPIFNYAADLKLAPFWAPFGVRPSKDGVTLSDDGRFVATFGLLKLETALDNIDGAHITSGYRWWTAVGARMSSKDDGLTFGTNADRGVCVHFRADRDGGRLRGARRRARGGFVRRLGDPAPMSGRIGAQEDLAGELRAPDDSCRPVRHDRERERERPVARAGRTGRIGRDQGLW